MYYITGRTESMGSFVFNYYDFASFKTKEAGEEYIKAKNMSWGCVRHIDEIMNHPRVYFHRSSVIL